MTDGTAIVDVAVRDLMTVRVVEFVPVPGTNRNVDVVFELQADKTRATRRVSVCYGKFPEVPLVEGGDVFMTSVGPDGVSPKDYDVIKQDAWEVVEHTTPTNKVGGVVGTHADTAWAEIEEWVVAETSKPSMMSTVNI